jgi:hypothetical protein
VSGSHVIGERVRSSSDYHATTSGKDLHDLYRLCHPDTDSVALEIAPCRSYLSLLEYKSSEVIVIRISDHGIVPQPNTNFKFFDREFRDLGRIEDAHCTSTGRWTLSREESRISRWTQSYLATQLPRHPPSGRSIVMT